MEKRHDIEAMVICGQIDAGRDIACGGNDVALQQRDDLRSRCRARGVKNKGFLITARRGGIGLILKQPEHASRIICSNHGFDHRD